MKARTIFLLLLLFLACPVASRAQGVDVPVGHWSYDFLERMEAKGVLERVWNTTLPLSRQEMASYLACVIEKVQIGDPRISRVDQDQLEWLKMEFYDELSWLGIEVDTEERHLMKWREGEDHLIVDFALNQRGASRNGGGEDYSLLDTAAEGLVRGGLRGSLFYSIHIKYAAVVSNKDYLSKEDVPLTGFFSSRGSYGYYDFTDAYLVLRLPWLDFQFGKQPFSWGPGRRGNLALSTNAPSFDYFLLRAKFWRLKFTSLTGFLKTTLIDSTRSYEEVHSSVTYSREEYRRKYIAAHRGELILWPGVKVGVGEAMIYGDRDLDPAYLNPLMFFWSAQHHWGDRDNEVMEADIKLNLIPGYTFYGAFLVDELYLKGLLTGNARNKVAYQGGVYLVDPLGLKDFDLRLEYTRVMPGVYTHKFRVNTYTNYGEILGYWSGENSDDLYLEARYRPSHRWELAPFFSRTRRGEHTEMPWAHSEPGRYPFLFGTVEWTRSFGLKVSYRPVEEFIISMGYKYTAVRNQGNQSGVHSRQNEFSLRVYVNY